MKRMYSDNEIKQVVHITEDEYGDVVINGGMSVSDSGDVTVGRDLYVEDEIVISDLSKIVDTDGNPLIVLYDGGYEE